jgi:hypothetical protein
VTASPQLFGKTECIGDAIAFLLGVLQAAAALDIKRRPRAVQSIGQPFRVSNEASSSWVFADADEDALTRCPWSRNGSSLHLTEQLLINPIRGAAKGELAERGEIGRGEKMP